VLNFLNDGQNYYALALQINLLYIPFTVSLPPKRDAKVGKYSIPAKQL
jgi:hypothetical protein